MIEAVYKTYMMSKRWWRQVLFWGLVFNSLTGFWALFLYAQFGNIKQLPELIALYGTVLTATLGAAGLRHLDKKIIAGGDERGKL